jgi:hypothetical protein
MRVGGLGGDDWTGPAAATRGAEGTGGEGRRTTDYGRREALAEGTAHLRAHPHTTVSIRGNGNGHGHGQAWVNQTVGRRVWPWH